METEHTQKQKQIIAIDSQRLSGIMDCARKYNWYHNQNLRLMNKSESLSKGSVVHDLLRAYYQFLIDSKPSYNKEEAAKYAISKLHEIGSEHELAIEDLFVLGQTFKEYHEFYALDNWVPLAVEESFSAVMYEDDDLVVLYEGIIDLVVEHKELSFLPVDHKTYSSKWPAFEINNQFVGYCWATGLNHFMRNNIGLNKQPVEKRLSRELYSYDDSVIEDWKQEALFWVNMLLYYHKNNKWPANFTSCDKFGGCMFRDLCKTTPDNREWKANALYVVGEGWNPLARK